MDFKNEADGLREAVRRLERKLGLLDDLQASCCGVTLAQCHAVVEIGRAKRLSLNELSEVLGLDKSTMSRTINNLVNNGLALRETDPNDRRYLTIRLTEKGMESFQEIENGMNKFFTRVYHLIPEAKRDQVIESLDLLINALVENDCCRR